MSANDKPKDKEPKFAQGTIVTEICCSKCGIVFTEEGNKNGEVVECADCGAELMVRTDA